MVRALKSLLAEKTLWRLLLRTFFGVLAVYLVRFFDFHPLSVLAALAVFGAIYFRELEERRLFRMSFVLLPILTVAAIGLISPIGPTGPIAVFAVLFFVLLGLIDFFFKERLSVYGVFSTALVALLSIVFFYLARDPGNFWFLGTAFFLVLYLLLKEAFGIWEAGLRRLTLSALILSFLGLELSYILQFLPLGFLNAALFLTLFSVLARDAVISSAKGNLGFSLMMKQVTFFVILAIIIFAAS